MCAGVGRADPTCATGVTSPDRAAAISRGAGSCPAPEETVMRIAVARLALAAAVLAAGGARAQTRASYQMFVDFDNINGNIQVRDNPLPVLTDLSKNGTLHLSFWAVANTIASYQGTF